MNAIIQKCEKPWMQSLGWLANTVFVIIKIGFMIWNGLASQL